MTDISDFPDSILCYILSFLPTKQVVATSVLSKRWNLLWLSVPSLDFDHNGGTDKEACSRFILSAYSFLLWRDKDQLFRRLRLRFMCLYNCNEIETWIKLAMRRNNSLEHLDLDLPWFIVVPSVVFNCKTLVVLKLTNLKLKNIPFIDFPLLKILHFTLCFLEYQDILQQFLSGTPNLEDLVVHIFIVKDWIANTAKKFYRLPKLIRANVDLHQVPLEIVKNVQVLMTDTVCQQDLVFDLQNLVQFVWTRLLFIDQWVLVLEVLRHCPKLQTVVIKISGDYSVPESEEEKTVLSYLLPVPTCLSLHLKSCCLHNYRGSVFEFKFAKYIMQNAKYLRSMKFCFNISTYPYNNSLRRQEIIRDLSSCIMSSDTCTLLFEEFRAEN